MKIDRTVPNKVQDSRTKFINFRIVMIFVFFCVMYIALLTRAFQLQILSSEILKERYKQQHANALETKQLITDLQHSFDKLSNEHRKLMVDTIILGGKKASLLKEIDELKPKYVKLSNDVQLLQKTLKELSILQENESQKIIIMYDQIYRKEKWSSFIMSFLMGILTSVIASVIYNSITRQKMSSMSYIIKIIKDRLILHKEK